MIYNLQNLTKLFKEFIDGAQLDFVLKDNPLPEDFLLLMEGFSFNEISFMTDRLNDFSGLFALEMQINERRIALKFNEIIDMDSIEYLGFHNDAKRNNDFSESRFGNFQLEFSNRTSIVYEDGVLSLLTDATGISTAYAELLLELLNGFNIYSYLHQLYKHSLNRHYNQYLERYIERFIDEENAASSFQIILDFKRKPYINATNTITKEVIMKDYLPVHDFSYKMNDTVEEDITLEQNNHIFYPTSIHLNREKELRGLCRIYKI